MQKAALPIIIAAVLFVLAVYYLIPGVYHPLASPATASHYKHAVGLAALGVLSLIWARFAANAPQR